MQVVSRDGTTGVLTLHEGAPDSPILLFVPAMGIQARWYRPLAQPLAAAGIRLARLEWRGHGESPVRPSRTSDWGYRELVEDITAALERLSSEGPLVLGGHSLGGQLGALTLALRPELARGLVTVASCSVWWRGFPPLSAARVLAGTQAARALGALLGSFPGHRVGFAGHEARGIMADWSSQALTGNYQLRGGPDVEHALRETQVPALLLSLAGDDWMAPQSAVEELARKLPGSTHVHVDDPSVRALQRPHVEWVAEPRAVLDHLIPWVLARAQYSTTRRAPAVRSER